MKVAVIGGGITGLTAARRLLQRSRTDGMACDIVLYEKENRLGGKIRTYREQGLVVEGGPDSMLARKPAGVQLLRDLGMEADIVYMNPGASQTFIVRNGRLHPMPQGTFVGIPADVPTFLASSLLSSQGKLRALADVWLPASHMEEDVSLGAFLRSRLGDEWVDYLGEPLLAGIYAGQIDHLSLFATWRQLYDLAVQSRSLIIGAIANRKRQQTHHSGPSGRSAFVTVRTGLESVIERLRDDIAQGVSIRTGTEISAMRRTADGYELQAVDENGAMQTDRFDGVVITTPVAAAKNLLHQLGVAGDGFVVPYASTATVILAYRKRDVSVDLSHASGFLVPRSEGMAMTASTWMSSKWPHTAPADMVVLRCYVGRAGQQEHLRLDDEAMVKQVSHEVGHIVGIQAEPTWHKVTRWSHAMPNYLVGHGERLQALRAAIQSQAPSLAVAGAGYEGLGLPDCILQGQQAADDVFTALSRR
ncbi:oxygen-dependent protoporphyrinogen oxidase [Alicyclobacillus sacchari]|uniref:Coproporphyrinogen III oxidase n=1 Tax=Alicyclobacillus sacchari TaxID=392010 RepID=A0A4R8LTK2_9BACL|nr:protoporphyrinogen oxidase [Alicyclobacillus sacchari]TDY51039.1 oxygen-dependent protoporphyrinogen oxidase [Alicyclobacillus sacchari]